MAASTSPLKRARSPVATRTTGTGVGVAEGIGDGVHVAVTPGVDVVPGEMEGTKLGRPQLSTIIAVKSPKSARIVRFMLVLILAKDGCVKQTWFGKRAALLR